MDSQEERELNKKSWGLTKLYRVESGVVNKPSVQTMAKIAKALRVNIEDLIKRTKESLFRQRRNKVEFLLW